jgi:LysM repeat protein
MFPIVLLAGLLLLTGCFRQADNEFQPVILDGDQGVQPTSSALFVEVTPDAATLEGSPLPFLEISPPETESGPTEEPPIVEFVLPTEDLTLTETAPETRVDGAAPLIVTVEISPTPPTAPTSSVPTVEGSVPTGPQFITPGAPSNPNVVIITNTPVPAEPEFTTTNTPSGLITPTGVFEALAANCIYVVRGGDSLYRIAIVNDTTVAALRAANPQISGDLIRPGQEMRLPDCEPEDPDAAPAVEVTAPAAAPTEIVAPTDAGGMTEYVVRPGDTLFNLAGRFGVTVSQIVQANNLANPNSLSIGQRLLIPSNP